MLYDAAGSIENSSSDYRDYTNEALDSITTLLSDPSTFLKSEEIRRPIIEAAGFDYNLYMTVLGAIWGLDAETLGLPTVSEPDYLHDTLVMIVWGLVGLVAAFVMFIRREF